MTLTTAISAPAQIVNGDASMGQQLAQKWCSDCHAVGAEDAEAYLRAQLCFDRGNVFQYWRTKLVFAQEHGAGLEAWQTRTRRETLTPLILVRIQVPQPGVVLKSLRICSFLARRNSLEDERAEACLAVMRVLWVVRIDWKGSPLSAL